MMKEKSDEGIESAQFIETRLEILKALNEMVGQTTTRDIVFESNDASEYLNWLSEVERNSREHPLPLT